MAFFNFTGNESPPIFSRIIEEFANSIKRYEKYPLEARFLMLTDKLLWGLSIIKALTLGAFETDIRRISELKIDEKEKSEKIADIHARCDKMETIFELFKQEINALEEFIQKDTKNSLEYMESKLDEVLMGPYYKAGLELMHESKKNFEQNIEN